MFLTVFGVCILILFLPILFGNWSIYFDLKLKFSDPRYFAFILVNLIYAFAIAIVVAGKF